MYLADPKGFHRFLAADLEHDRAVQTAVISAGNSVIVTGSQAASIQVGRKAGQLPNQKHLLQIQLTEYGPVPLRRSS